MPHKIPHDKLPKRAVEVLEYMRHVSPCATITTIAKALNLSWTYAREIMTHLTKSGLIIEVAIKHRVLWCINKKAASIEIAILKRELWRVICASKRKFIKPSQIYGLIAEDAEARKIFAKYINVDKISGNALKFLSALIEDLIGPPLEKTSRKVLFHVPPKICENKPPLDNIQIRQYKQPHKIVTFKVSPAMYMDLLTAADSIGTTIPHLVRMAIARLLSQYRHLIQ
jgi:predicted transcriptional regulator